LELGLKGKVALVTGAGRHIGRQIALTLAEEGAFVGVNDFFGDRADQVAEEIRRKSGQALPLKADVTNGEEIEGIVNSLAAKFGKVDILVNNAGIKPFETDQAILIGFRRTQKKDWDSAIKVNLYGAFNCTRAVLNLMCKKQYGKIINIMSDAGRIGELGLVAYSAAKAGLAGFTKALAKEVAPFCINVNSVSLGAVPGPSLDEQLGKTPEERDQRLQEQFQFYPLAKGLGRLGLPSDCANLVAFLASDVAEWITGQIISVSGGLSMVD
jgi:2-hydroxycyclohexanecarboxyl-CoA dehydrogenase